jgi:hypothetical protein
MFYHTINFVVVGQLFVEDDDAIQDLVVANAESSSSEESYHFTSSDEEEEIPMPIEDGETSTDIAPMNIGKEIVPTDQSNNEIGAIETAGLSDETTERLQIKASYASYPPSVPTAYCQGRRNDVQDTLDRATLAEASLQQSIREGHLLLGDVSERKRASDDAQATDRMSLRKYEEARKDSNRAKRGKK